MFANPDKYEEETEDPLEALLARDPVTMAPFEAPAEEDKAENKDYSDKKQKKERRKRRKRRKEASQKLRNKSIR